MIIRWVQRWVTSSIDMGLRYLQESYIGRRLGRISVRYVGCRGSVNAINFLLDQSFVFGTSLFYLFSVLFSIEPL